LKNIGASPKQGKPKKLFEAAAFEFHAFFARQPRQYFAPTDFSIEFFAVSRRQRHGLLPLSCHYSKGEPDEIIHHPKFSHCDKLYSLLHKLNVRHGPAPDFPRPIDPSRNHMGRRP
jgi:hypothetical protein